jgi:hypothetical protein
MAHYFLRIELHECDSTDFQNLHDELAEIGFHRAVQINGGWLDLPNGEYYKPSKRSITLETRLIITAILKVINENDPFKTKDYSYVLTDSIDSSAMRMKLKPNTDSSKQSS